MFLVFYNSRSSLLVEFIVSCGVSPFSRWRYASINGLADLFRSWDDWVPQERLRKFTEENRQLATTLRRDVEASLRRPSKPASKRRCGGSDRSSAGGSEDRQISSNARGTKRNRDNEIEKVDLSSLMDLYLHVPWNDRLTLLGGELRKTTLSQTDSTRQHEVPAGG